MAKASASSRIAQLLPGAVLAFSAAAATAQSLQPAQCLPRADMLAALAKDQQAPIIVGNRIFSANSNSNVFTSNPQGTLGYNIEGDAPYGVPSNTVCVRAAYTNVRVNSTDNPTVPAWFPAIKDTSDMDLAGAYRRGGRVLMLADTFTQGAEGQKAGQMLAVVWLPSGAGAIKAISAAGRSQDVAGLKAVQLTDNAKPLITATAAGPGPVAALTLK